MIFLYSGLSRGAGKLRLERSPNPAKLWLEWTHSHFVGFLAVAAPVAIERSFWNMERSSAGGTAGKAGSPLAAPRSGSRLVPVARPSGLGPSRAGKGAARGGESAPRLVQSH